MNTKTKEARINEIMAQLTACDQEKYRKEEVIPALLELQQQLVQLVFDEKHAELSKYRIWDVQRHLAQMNIDVGDFLFPEVDSINARCKIINNMIASEFSGRAGERKAFWSLETVRCDNLLLKNVELKSSQHRTELDGIMFTSKGIFIIEVKNSKRDISIDTHGNYYRIGQTMIFDKNIGERMNEKTHLLRNALIAAGVSDPHIANIVVFTNNAIQIDNQYPHINTCFLSELPHFIEGYQHEAIYTHDDIQNMHDTVKEAQCQEAYPLEIDMAQFKLDFATLLTLLEMTNSKEKEPTPEQPEPTQPTEPAPPKVSLASHKKAKSALGIGIVLTCAAAVVAYTRIAHRR